MASQVTLVVRCKWNLVFTAKETTAIVQDDLQSNRSWAWGIWANCLSLGRWWQRYVKGFYYSFIPTSKQKSMNEGLSWALKNKCPLSLQLQQVNRLDQRLVLLIKAHSNKMSTLESFRHAWEDNVIFYQLYMLYNKIIWIVTPVCFLYRELFFTSAVRIEVRWAHGIVWHVARKAFFPTR